MPSGNETRMSHVNVHFAPTRVAPDHDTLLPDEVLKIATVEPRDGHRSRLLSPLHLRRRRRRLQREQRPRVALRAPRELSLGHVSRAQVSPALRSARGARSAAVGTRAHHKFTRAGSAAPRPGCPEPADCEPALRFEVTDGTHMRKVSTCAVNKNYINHHTTT